MSYTHIGQHRVPAAVVRVDKRAARLRRREKPVLVTVGLWWAGVLDLVRIPWRNARLRVIDVWARWVVPTGVPDIPICPTCRQNEHRACGWLIDDPACGCHCTAAQQHRIELATIEGWANA